MKDNQPKERVCGNCKHFMSNKGKTIYTRGSGYCEINFDEWEKEKNNLKKDERPTKSVPQIFNYFKCSNNKFIEK